MKKEFEIITLTNGIRIIFKKVPYAKIVHCGYVLDIGTRDENEHEEGIAHFWEHMSFKGTKNRTAKEILYSLENVGGELNAYTTKEKMWFHASVPKQYFSKAVDVLTDIVFNSTFPTKELNIEKGVVLEEIAMYKDSPEEFIQDEFEHLLFKKHALGNYILGTKKSVQSFTTSSVKKFVKENMDTSKIVFSIVGNLQLEEVEQVVNQYIKSIKKQKSVRNRSLNVKASKSFVKSISTQTAQSHCVLGWSAYSFHHELRLPLFLLSNWLGGPAMTSRLNLLLREKLGYVYAIESSYQGFQDSGMVTFYFGTDKKQLQPSLAMIDKELTMLKKKAISEIELEQLKEQVCGQLLMAEESLSNVMQMMGKSLLDFNYVESLDEIVRKIKKVSTADLLFIANDIFKEETKSQLTLMSS
jgi:predicted Zn-dependent peptidase